jgi:hypothetical protein
VTIEVICPQVNSSACRFLLTSGGDGEASSVVWIVLSTSRNFKRYFPSCHWFPQRRVARGSRAAGVGHPPERQRQPVASGCDGRRQTWPHGRWAHCPRAQDDAGSAERGSTQWQCGRQSCTPRRKGAISYALRGGRADMRHHNSVTPNLDLCSRRNRYEPQGTPLVLGGHHPL